MSSWLQTGEVLVGEGQGEAPLSSPRGRGGGRGSVSPRQAQSRAAAASPSPSQGPSDLGTSQQDSEIIGEEEAEEDRLRAGEAYKADPEEEKFTQILVELGAEKLFKDQWELRALWCGLHKERPELLCVLEELLSHTVSHLQDALKERDSLEQALRRRECDHDHVVRSIYEEMDAQIREEKAKRLAQESVRHNDRSQELQEELKIREQELESTVAQQRELESRIRALSSEHTDTRSQNEHLRRHNSQLQEQLETSRAELQSALQQLEHIQTSTAQEQRGRERDVLKVSKNMQKEKESLLRQLELLREMNKRLRDEKDAHQSQRVSYRRSLPFTQCQCGHSHSFWAQPIYPS
ncbi:hypothetical protein JZ751_015890 [Albula glossodonta]|uniref:EF-hand calcium-binding domain-containing protein 4A n=1 Tax=Albula glossodonta TaxID=121402 RepID=A0A8T2ML52_9TELE|nr:hypothetical protein JZ751_015890 [Albula glossodonta]